MYHSITIHKELNMFGVRDTYPKQQAYTCARVTERDISDLKESMQRWLGRYSVFSIATHYGLHGSKIESQSGEGDFPHPSRPANPASYIRGIESFPGVERPRRGADHPHPSSAKIKERVELYIYSSGPLLPVLGWTLFNSGSSGKSQGDYRFSISGWQ